MDEKANEARDRLLDWLAGLGPRWGLPGEACRVHGYLYLLARPAASEDLSSALDLSADCVRDALAWLGESGLVEETEPGLWRTEEDPWALVTRALEARRRAELATALDILRAGRRDAAGEPLLERQIGRLLDLVEDVSALSEQAQRIPPRALRGLLSAGGRAARMIGGPARPR